MKKQSLLITGLLIVIAIAFIIIAINSFGSNSSGDTDTSLSLEINPFDLVSQKITPTYVELGIKNRGEQGYLIQSINLPGCGSNNGGNVPKGYSVKTFSIPCNSRLTEKSPFMQEATIRYGLLSVSGEISTQTIMVSGNVLEKKCFYSIYGESAPYSSGTCDTKMDCIKRTAEFAERQGVSLSDITVLDCMYG